MSDELKPCPFCGGKAFFDQEDGGGHFVMCDRCSASTNLRYACGDDPRPLLAEQWNRRTNPTAPSAEDRYCDSHCTWADHAPGCKYAPSAESEAVAWMWQHDETGRVGFVDPWQVENGWQANNPRCRLIRPLYATPPALPAEITDEAIRKLAREHATGGADLVGADGEREDEWHGFDGDDILAFARALLAAQVRPLPDAARDDVLHALDLDPAQYRTEGGVVNAARLRAALLHPDEYLPPDHWLRAAKNPPAEKLLALADRIDHEQLWRRSPLEHRDWPQDQQDRLFAGVELRRYARLRGQDCWTIFPPKGGVSFSASVFAKAVEMAGKEAKRRGEDAPPLPDAAREAMRMAVESCEIEQAAMLYEHKQKSPNLTRAIDALRAQLGDER